METWEERLHQYITAIVQNNNHKMLAINSAFDHTHCLAGVNPKQSISNLLELVKGDSSEFINKHQLTGWKFNWQSGYGAFSVSRSHLDKAVKYVHNQKMHHQKQTFRKNIYCYWKNMKLCMMRNIFFMTCWVERIFRDYWAWVTPTAHINHPPAELQTGSAYGEYCIIETFPFWREP